MKHISPFRVAGVVSGGFFAAFVVHYQGYLSAHPLPDHATTAALVANLHQGALVSIQDGILGALIAIAGGFVNLDRGAPATSVRKRP